MSIRDTGRHLPRVDPDRVATSLGAEPMRYRKWSEIRPKKKDPDTVKEVTILEKDKGTLPVILYPCITETGYVPVTFETWSDGKIIATLQSPHSPWGEGKTFVEAAEDLGESIAAVIRLLAPFAREGKMRDGTPAFKQWELLSTTFDVNACVKGNEDDHD